MDKRSSPEAAAKRIQTIIDRHYEGNRELFLAAQKENGRKGGKISRGGGFAYDRVKAVEMGRKGGLARAAKLTK